jgi:hypothetical protein
MKKAMTLRARPQHRRIPSASDRLHLRRPAGALFLAIAAVTITPLDGRSQQEQHDTAGVRACADLKVDADWRASAVRCAQRFVVQQGYTDSLATADSATIVYEGMEAGDTWRAVLEWRHNTLIVPALGICDFGNDSYDVIFSYADSTQSVGRSVRVSKDLADVSMVHQDFMLRALTSHAQCQTL